MSTPAVRGIQAEQEEEFKQCFPTTATPTGMGIQRALTEDGNGKKNSSNRTVPMGRGIQTALTDNSNASRYRNSRKNGIRRANIVGTVGKRCSIIAGTGADRHATIGGTGAA
jgi:hypothetical protein